MTLLIATCVGDNTFPGILHFCGVRSSHFRMLAQKKNRAKFWPKIFLAKIWPENFKGILGFFGILRFFMTSQQKKRANKSQQGQHSEMTSEKGH